MILLFLPHSKILKAISRNLVCFTLLEAILAALSSKLHSSEKLPLGHLDE